MDSNSNATSGKIVPQSNNLIEIVKRIVFLKDLKQIKSVGKKYAYIENKIIYVFAGGEFLIDPTSAAKCELTTFKSAFDDQ